MVNKRLVTYIHGLLQKGYTISTIRNFLLKYGYTDKEIDNAAQAIYNPVIRHELHLTPAALFAVIFIFVSLLGIASFFYYGSPKAPAKLLDLNLEPVTATAAPGENIVFVKELSNLGSSKRYDVTIKQEIINSNTNSIITHKTETRAIETFGSTQTRIPIPKDAKAGSYLLRVIVEYDGKKAVATLPVSIVAPAKNETCSDGTKNQNEEDIDCGGICKPCRRQIVECNDGNPCTRDSVESGLCVNKPIRPCCGNSICEQNEGVKCKADCETQEAIHEPLPSPPISAETLDEIKEAAKSNPVRAMQQCGGIEVPDLRDTCIGGIGEVQRDKNYCAKIANARIKDLCYANIAKSLNDNSLCEEISMDSRKDSCYMTFVLDNKDYSVCGRITNRHLQQSCESLRQLNEISMQVKFQEQENEAPDD